MFLGEILLRERLLQALVDYPCNPHSPRCSVPGNRIKGREGKGKAERTTSSWFSPIFLPMSLLVHSSIPAPPLDWIPGTTRGILLLLVVVVVVGGLDLGLGLGFWSAKVRLRKLWRIARRDFVVAAIVVLLKELLRGKRRW